MDPVLLARGLIRLHGGHLRQLFAGKAVRLGIGQAPVRIAVIALEPVRPPVQLDRLPDVAAGLVNVGQRNGKDRIAGESLHQQLVVFDGGIVPAHAAAGGGVQRPHHGQVVALLAEQDLRLFVRLRELLHPQQQVGVLDAGIAMFGLELHAAFQQEFGFPEDTVAGGDFGQQPDPFHVRPVAAQELPAELLRLVQPVLGEIADDGQQLARQSFQVFDLLQHRPEPGMVGAAAVEPGQAFPAIDQGRVRLDGTLEGFTGAGVVPAAEQVVADLLVRPPVAGPNGQHPVQ